MMNTSARNSTLRAILADDEIVRSTVLEMVTSMESIEKEDVRGFRLASLLDLNLSEAIVNSKMKSFQLDVQQHELLCNLIQHTTPGQHPFPMQALFIEEISLCGVPYATAGSSKFRNSKILFRPYDAPPSAGAMQTQKAGVIQSIFQYCYQSLNAEPIKHFYLAVQEHSPMETTNNKVDPYRQFNFAGGFLCEGRASKMHVIELSQVISHVAWTRLKGDENEELVHVLPVDRVQYFFSSDDLED
jgi:hypothetical protein